MNKVILQGRLTKDPEFSKGKNDTILCRFTVAVDRYNAKTGETEAYFIPCIMFGERADCFGHYTIKGDRVLIEGHLDVNTRKEEDGTWKTFVNVVAENFDFIHARKGSNNENGIENQDNRSRNVDRKTKRW